MPAAQLLYDTFSAFGMIIQTPKIMRDPETGGSKGFGFVSYDSFEASDAAIESMSGQFLCNRRARAHAAQAVQPCVDGLSPDTQNHLVRQPETRGAPACLLACQVAGDVMQGTLPLSGYRFVLTPARRAGIGGGCRAGRALTRACSRLAFAPRGGA